METDKFEQTIQAMVSRTLEALFQPDTYAQLGIVVIALFIAWAVARLIHRRAPVLDPSVTQRKALFRIVGRMGGFLAPVLNILLLRIGIEIGNSVLEQVWMIDAALILASLLLFVTVINRFVRNRIACRWIKWVGVPILSLHLLGILGDLVELLESVALRVGNIEISAYDIIRVLIFGSLLLWLAGLATRTGRDIIGRQENLDIRTREVSVKLFEVAVFFLVFLLILQVMGINLTALAVFGGAVGVGLGFGLQAIASNFISGIIILLDRSVSIGDYVQIGDDAGYVRELNMRLTTIETFEGKDIMVPNEKFIVEPFVNWTHKDKRQRYRVDFSVAYGSDVRGLVEIIKAVVAGHEQVLSGDDLAIEMRPDCEIDSFGDSGINMFVEFWMEGIDDGKNRVGGDLLLMIYEALREHGFEIPFPQREVRVLNPSFNVGPMKKMDP